VTASTSLSSPASESALTQMHSDKVAWVHRQQQQQQHRHRVTSTPSRNHFTRFILQHCIVSSCKTATATALLSTAEGMDRHCSSYLPSIASSLSSDGGLYEYLTLAADLAPPLDCILPAPTSAAVQGSGCLGCLSVWCLWIARCRPKTIYVA
jgi:hypothetical protein